MQQQADIQLARRLIKGDVKSFDVFFNSYFPRIYRFALVRLNRDHDLAEETAQVVLCQALSKMSTYRGEAPLFSWLCTFARFELSRQRKASTRAQGDVELTEDNSAVQAALESLLAESSSDPQLATHQAQLRRLIGVAMDHLPSLYAEALERKYVFGESVRDMARGLGKSEKAMESTLTRARVAFRDAYTTLAQEALHPGQSGYASKGPGARR